MNARCFLLCLALGAPVWRCATAQVTVEKPTRLKTRLDLSAVEGRPSDYLDLFRTTLAADLNRSGWFVLCAPGEGEVAVGVGLEVEGDSALARCRVTAAGRGVLLHTTLRQPREKTRRLAHSLADEIVWAVKRQPGIASTQIAMIGARGQAKELFVCDADGASVVQLTDDRSVGIGPRWHPQRPELFYTSFHRGFPDVYRIDLRSNRRILIAGFPGLNTGAAASPDGDEIALTLSKDGNPELYVMDLRSRALTRLTRTPHAAEASPAWSPDGKRLAYVSDTTGRPQIYIVARSGGAPRRVTYRGRENVSPDWSPSPLLAYASQRQRRYEIHVLDPDGGEESGTAVAAEANADFESPSWAPDGRHIACARTENYRSAIYILDTHGDPSVRLTAVAGEFFTPAWSRHQTSQYQQGR